MIKVCVALHLDQVTVDIPEADDWNTSASGTLNVTKEGETVAEFHTWQYVMKPMEASV